MAQNINHGTSLTISVCSLNQTVLDYTGNLRNIMISLEESKKRGAKYRFGPELELWYINYLTYSGYGCQDHFYEQGIDCF